ncbi:MAG: hypothetical protein GKR89_23265 [Candidatus Latescibacteria bacterium]|nr:hypothetical protein [Candidatus Latescibacterota bacterium]
MQRQAQRLAAGMEALDLVHKIVVFPGEHAMPEPPGKDQEEALAWFGRHLF